MLTKCNATVLLTVILLTPLAAQALSNWDIFDDAVIEEGGAYNVVNVYDTPPGHTTVNMTGGLVDMLWLHDSSTFNVTGGTVYTALAAESATLDVSGQADIYGVNAGLSSTVNISGGNLHNAAVADTAVLNMSAGDVEYGISLTDAGTMNFMGGTTAALRINDAAVANIHGGNLVEGIQAWRFSGLLVNVYGTDLAKTASGGLYGYGQVSGIYPDGSAFVIDLGEGVYPHVALIPEPATLLLLSLGGVIHRYCEHSTRTHARTGGDVC